MTTETELRRYLGEAYGVGGDLFDLVSRSEEALYDTFRQIDSTARLNQARVLCAFQEEEIAARHFNGTTGYGYGDEGRDKLGKVYARVFGAEDAIVSPLIMSGTHAISEALFGLLRPGDEMVCITGEPYDTLQPVIRGGAGSLEEFGIGFRAVPLLSSGGIDLQAAQAQISSATKLIYLQRSTGYDLRPAFTTAQLAEAVAQLRRHHPDCIYMVDNCYGEFVNSLEPTAAGADVIAGSLIKNPGGGLAPSGGYIAGRRDLMELVGSRYAAPGVAREIGSYAPGYQYFFQGLFLAPHMVAQALKGVVLAADVFSRLGYEVSPGPLAERGDITQTIIFHDADALIAFVRGIQSAAPVDSNVVPYAWDMPGYEDPVIMAAGTFVQGASLEHTADGPLRPPYAAYLQGGLTYEHAFLATVLAVSTVLNDAR